MTAQIGLVGLGTMGAALALNIADNGFRVAVFNRTSAVTQAFLSEAGPLRPMLDGADTLESLVGALEVPRAIILMVPAGEAVDDMIAALRPMLGPDDLLVDAGNANFHDTRRRALRAKDEGWPYLGIGVSGGEAGARKGPAIMGGGARNAWDRVAPILTRISADFKDTPCADWMGPDGAGHFVKTVHNGIEYADMQMIAEVYGVMRDGLDMDAAAISEVFARWNAGPLRSYLIEISAEVARIVDPDTSRPMLDVILDRAGQKGTGRWTAIEAQHLGAAVPSIDAAVTARNLSAVHDDRQSGERIFGAAPERLSDGPDILDRLERALLAGKIAAYAQGFELLNAGSTRYDWSLNLAAIARVWRAGCIIRSTLLDDMAGALEAAEGRNLMFAPVFADMMKQNNGALRSVVARAALGGTPAPALGSALSYFDIMRTGRSTANMLQAQRDFFGAHGFERVDRDGAHHGPWDRF